MCGPSTIDFHHVIELTMLVYGFGFVGRSYLYMFGPFGRNRLAVKEILVILWTNDRLHVPKGLVLLLERSTLLFL